uniref:Uncharacterized protein n=1 Tax=Rangifer tarandus platyrhynchus TaxID=3082113 RepID=A0ACB0DUI3_RANTA|nr:unnamed protein product [Rangifer tarandus platyrhynchus]
MERQQVELESMKMTTGKGPSAHCCVPKHKKILMYLMEKTGVSSSEASFLFPQQPQTSPISISYQPWGSSLSPRPQGTARSPDSPRNSDSSLRRPPPTQAPLPAQALPAPPQRRPGPILQPAPAGVPSSPLPRQASSRSYFLLFPRTTPWLQRGAPPASTTRRSRQARAPLTPQPGRRGSCCGGSSACASPPPSRPPPWPPLSLGLLPAGPGPAPLHLVPNSGRRSPVSCIDPEAAFQAQQQHVTPPHVSRPLREWEGAPEEQVLPDQAEVAVATGMSRPAG